MRHCLLRLFQLVQFTTTVLMLLGLMFMFHYVAMNPLGKLMSLFA